MSSIKSPTLPSSDTAEMALQVGDTPPATSFGATQDGDLSPEAPERRMNRIAKRAHELYEARGGAQGTALDDWLAAERQIDAEIDRAQEPTDRTKLEGRTD